MKPAKILSIIISIFIQAIFTGILMGQNPNNEEILTGDLSAKLSKLSQTIHFVFKDNTGDSYSLVVTNATLNGAQLETGDEIGVFTPAGLCVGASTWTGTTPLALTAWIDDAQTPEIDGYAAGEIMSYKIFDSSAASESPATPTYTTGNGEFGNQAYSQLTLAATSGNTISMIVTNTNDIGPGSLREAIEQANNHPGPDLITFNIPKNVPGYDGNIGVWRIMPISPLPVITDDNLVIDGFSQNNYIGGNSNPNGPEIEIHGDFADYFASGLEITASGVEIYRLTINNFSNQSGILMTGVQSGIIAGCYIGITSTGDATSGNYHGIKLVKSMNVHIVPADTLPNVISGNAVEGVAIIDSSWHNIIRENIIGLDYSLSYGIGNSYGVSLFNQCGDNDVVENFIGKNLVNGIDIIESSHNYIGYNYIGTDELWELELGNLNNGIYISSTDSAEYNTIEENVIGYNSAAGIAISGINSRYNTFSRNRISRNAGPGINNDNNANMNLQPPTILSAVGNQVSGSAGPDQTVEIFIDENDEGMFYMGFSISDAAGAFTVFLNEAFVGSYNLTATATDNLDNTSNFSSPYIISAIEQESVISIPEQFQLYQNYPNPFNPSTMIKFRLLKAQHTKIEIYNSLGQQIKTLLNQKMSPGKHELKFNAVDLPGGVYIYKIMSGDFIAVKKMLYLK